MAVNVNKTAPDFTQTKAAIAAAEAAGRPDTWTTDVVQRYEKAVAEGKAAEAAANARVLKNEAAGDAVDIGKRTRELQKGSITQRVEAANALAAAGADAAEILGYALETDSVISVRQAAVNSLRRMGAGARRALPALSRYIRTTPSAILNPTKDEMSLEFMESDLRKDAAEIVRRLR